MAEQSNIKAAVLLADGFEEVEAVTPIDFLRRAEIDTIIVGVSGREVAGGHNIYLTSDVSLSELDEDLDAVIIPGGMPGAENLSKSEKVVELITKMRDQGKLIAAICASPAVVLGSHGFLKDKTYTCYPGFEKDVADGTHSNDRVVIDGSLITSRGPGTAAEFAVAIIRYLRGADAAQSIHRKTLQKGDL
jgi:4-methyl-5(b-hydroxyethyl)-thiazole monophosphate biosynthesis